MKILAMIPVYCSGNDPSFEFQRHTQLLALAAEADIKGLKLPQELVNALFSTWTTPTSERKRILDDVMDYLDQQLRERKDLRFLTERGWNFCGSVDGLLAIDPDTELPVSVGKAMEIERSRS